MRHGWPSWDNPTAPVPVLQYGDRMPVVDLRPVQVEDANELHSLIRAIELADGQHWLTALEEVHDLISSANNPADDNLRAVWSADRMVGWGRVRHSPSGEKLERAMLAGAIHPDYRRQGLGTELLRWQVQQARHRLDSTTPELEAIVIADRYDGQDDRGALFASAGFSDARWFDELQRDLNDLPPITEPDGITIVPWTTSHHETARQVYNVAFLDHWGTTPRSEEDWLHDVIDEPGRRIDLSFVAFDGDEMVGYCLNSHYPDDEQVTGRRDGWVESICTLRSHRGRGIASALINNSLHSFAAAGLNSSMLGVDANNPTGAYGIYERLGYRPLHRGIASILTVREGSAPVEIY